MSKLSVNDEIHFKNYNIRGGFLWATKRTKIAIKVSKECRIVYE